MNSMKLYFFANFFLLPIVYTPPLLLLVEFYLVENVASLFLLSWLQEVFVKTLFLFLIL